jgi:hypothetical protein
MFDDADMLDAGGIDEGAPGGSVGGGGGVLGASEIDGPSAIAAPQKRQNADDGSDPPRQRGHRRSIASAWGAPRSTTRPGAIGPEASGAGGRMVCAEGSWASAGGDVRAAGDGPPGETPDETGATDAATAGGGRLNGASRWPHVTQKRRLRGFRWPQSGQAGISAASLAPPAAGGSVRPPKCTSGAGGRCGTIDGGLASKGGRGSVVGPDPPIAITGAGAAALRAGSR